jgi:hypothetical protein
MIEYQVCHADWAPEDFHADHQKEYPDPSDTLIDDRTIRVKTFATESDALEYAKKYLAKHNNTQWLAYLEVRKIESEVIRKLV